MLKEIEIQNFRCFEQIQISGFERVNLIGGKNNVGKTALLEAVFLNVAPDAGSLAMLRELRRESLEALEAMPKRAWDNLFYALKKERFIVIIRKDENDKVERVEISIDNINEIGKDPSTEEIRHYMSMYGSSVSVITVKLKKDENKPVTSSVMASSGGLITTDGISTTREIPIIPSFRISGKKLTEAYDNARLDDKDSEILKEIIGG